MCKFVQAVEAQRSSARLCRLVSIASAVFQLLFQAKHQELCRASRITERLSALPDSFLEIRVLLNWSAQLSWQPFVLAMEMGGGRVVGGGQLLEVTGEG